MTHLELRKFRVNLISSIKLERLRTLAIHHDQPSKSNFINIYCPNLVHFSTNATNWTPRSCYYMPRLRTLICAKFDDWIRHQSELESLVIRQIESNHTNLLVYLPKLRYLDVSKIEKEDLLAILSGREVFKRDDLRVCVGAIPVQMNEIERQLAIKSTAFSRAGSMKLIDFYLRHQSEMLADLHFLGSLKFLARLRPLQPAFFRRLVDVREVIVNADHSKNYRHAPLGRQELYNVLRELPLVHDLTINEGALRDLVPSFFDELPKICQLVTLTVHGKRGSPIMLASYRFLLQMNQIDRFAFHHNSSHQNGPLYLDRARNFALSTGLFKLEFGSNFLILYKLGEP